MARPSGSTAEDTRRTILIAAMNEFAEHGFAGARVSNLVAACKVRVNTIYYHFGSKELLFIAVMEEVYTRIRAGHREVEVRDLEPEAAIRQLTRQMFAIFRNDQKLVALLTTENLLKAEQIRKSKKLTGLYDPIIGTIRDIVQSGVARGIFRDDVNPIDLFISINALGYFYISNQHTLSVILNDHLDEPGRVARHEDHIVAFVLGFLRDRSGADCTSGAH